MTNTPSTWDIQVIQQRIDAIRQNVMQRDGRELTFSEVVMLRKRLAAELAGLEVRS